LAIVVSFTGWSGRSRQRHPRSRPERDQPVDHHDRAVPLVIVERVHPLDDLVMQLYVSHRTQYRTNAMIAQQL
jgi:hypothetical protein